jgi:hypothetical protein
MTTNHGGPFAYVTAAFLVAFEYLNRWLNLIEGTLSLYVDLVTAVSVTIAAIMAFIKLRGMLRGVESRGSGAERAPDSTEVQ